MSTKTASTNQEITSAQTEKLFCPWCKKDVTFHMKRVNHRTELIRAICSAGLWVPFWLLLTVASKNKLCDECGNDIREYEV